MWSTHNIILMMVVVFLMGVGISFAEITTDTLSETLPTTATVSESSATGAKEQALEFLEKLEEKYEDVETISGEFSQLKRSTVFLEEIKSQGIFYFKKPGRFRCDYLPPNESINLVVNDTAWLYVPEIKQVEKYYFGKSATKVQRLNQMLLGFGISVEDVKEVYDVKRVKEKEEDTNTIAIQFVLREENPDVNFESVTIWFDRETLLVKKIYVDEVGDDETIIDIKKIDLNPEISDALFRPMFPGDVEIIEHY